MADDNDISIKVVVFDGYTKASNIKYRNEYGYKCLIVLTGGLVSGITKQDFFSRVSSR